MQSSLEQFKANARKSSARTQGIEALRILEEHEGGIDLVLTDIGLPHMRGPELVERA